MHGWHHQAWEETRRPKPKVKEGPAELSERVRAELAEAGFDFTPGRDRGKERAAASAPSVAQVGRDEVAGEVVAGLSAARSAWSGAELTTATERALVRTGVVGDPQAVAELAEDVRARAEARCTSVLVGDEKVPSVMSRYLTSAAVIDADMALNLGLAGLAADEGPSGRRRPAWRPGRRAWTPARPTPWPPSPARPAWRWWSARRGRARRPCWPRPGRPCPGPGAVSSWCWPPPARRPRWPERSWARRPRRWPSCSTTTAGAGTTSGAMPVPLVVPGQPLPPSGQAYEGPGGRLGLPAGSVVVVDEAGLLSVDQAVALVDVVTTGRGQPPPGG